jgi:hypothetical protein
MGTLQLSDMCLHDCRGMTSGGRDLLGLEDSTEGWLPLCLLGCPRNSLCFLYLSIFRIPCEIAIIGQHFAEFHDFFVYRNSYILLCRHVQGHLRLLLSREVQVQLMPLWWLDRSRCSKGLKCKNVQVQPRSPIVKTFLDQFRPLFYWHVQSSRFSKGLCGVYTTRCSSGFYGLDMSRNSIGS